MPVAASQARELLIRHGICVDQDANDWTGSIPLPAAIAQFYTQVGPRNIEVVGYGNPTFIPSLALLWERQTGYRWNGLTGERIDDWPDNWIVVADEGADPYIHDAKSGRILFAHHGSGNWDAGEIYPDLNTMAACIATLGGVIKDADEFTDDDCLIDPQHREKAVMLLADILGSSSEAEAIVVTAGWYPAHVLRDKHGINSENRPYFKVVVDDVPEPLRELIPYVERWAIPCDVTRGDYLDKQPQEDVADFYHTVLPFTDQIRAWLGQQPEDVAEWSDAAVHYMYFLKAHAEAHQPSKEELEVRAERHAE